jgi:aspartyl-tRNA synthetase
MRVLIRELGSHVDKQVIVKGFAQTLRRQSKLVFIVLRDVSGEIQVVVRSEQKKTFDVAKQCSAESVIEVNGKVVKQPGKTGALEVQAKEIRVLSSADPVLPIPVVEKTNSETDLQKRLDWRWIDLRKQKNLLIFKVWTSLEAAFREYWIENGYLEIHSPKFMGTPSESGAELFAVPYFNMTAYLAQSPQFYKQMAMASGLERVFEVGPVFRANPSFTSRHDTEFTGYDAEIAYIDSHHEVMDAEERALAYMLKYIKKAHGKEIMAHYGRDISIPKLPFPKISFSEAKAVLSARGVVEEKPTDLSSEEEKELSKYILETTNSEFVFVYDYPYKGRAFYSMRYDENPELCKGFDLLWNGLEITSGAQREHRYNKLLENIQEKEINLEHIKTYADFFKYGCPPHGGYGLSPSRLLMKLFNVGNVREVTYVYRGINRLDP